MGHMATELVRLADVRDAARSGEARRLRVAAELSLAEVARAVGVAVPTVLRWERGERTPRGKPAIRYAKLLEALEKREAGCPASEPRADTVVHGNDTATE